MATATHDYAADLKDLRERIDDLEGELSRMPAFKRGTEFESARLRARDYLRRSIARHEGELQTK